MPRAPKRQTASKKRKATSRDKVRAYRERKRQEGLRPVQFWLPDTKSEEFHREAARQSRLIRESPGEEEVMDFIESIADWSDR